jgi:Ni/Co efflux regulator RcnB
MKILIAAVSSTLLLLTAAQAQNDRANQQLQQRAQDQREHDERAQERGRPRPTQKPEPRMGRANRQDAPATVQRNDVTPGSPNRPGAQSGPGRRDFDRRRDNRHDAPTTTQRNDVTPGWPNRPGAQSGPGRRDFDRRRDNRPDWNRFHGNFHAERRFHAKPWHPPRGYQYRRWTYGERLPSLYYSRSLWISTFALFGLMAPPPDTVWVRSGPDALLVDRDTGEIIRVQYGVFY